MAGTWKAQNKKRPGAYINVVGNGKPLSDSPIGRLLMINNVKLGWGRTGVIPLTGVSDFRAELGHKLDDPTIRFIKEALKGAETVLFINTNDGTKATGTAETSPWNFTAKYPGEVGNNLQVSIEAIPEKAGGDATRATVTTLFGTSIVEQVVIRLDQVAEYTGNDYLDAEVNSSVSKFPTSPVTVKMTGGTTTQRELTDMIDDALDNENYAVATTAGMETTSNVHSLLVESIKRLRENEGVKVRAVIPVDESAPVYNYEGVTTVANGFIEGDGTKISTTDATAFFAGISASANEGESLTYYDVSDAIEAYPRLNNEKTIEALDKGQVVFTTRPGQRVVVEEDINSLVKFTVNRPYAFRKNRVVRAVDEICRNTADVFERQFLGKVANNANGRDVFEANRVSYLVELQNKNVIQDFDTTDIKVSAGESIDSVVVDLAVKPVDAMEKLYMTLTVN